MNRGLLEEIRHLVRPIANRVANLVARAVVQLSDDDAKMQLLQIGVLAGETIDDAERVQEYGFTSRPHDGAEAVVLFSGGDRAHPLVIAVDDRRYRVTSLDEGEVVIYTDEGDEIRLGRGGVVTVTAGTELRLGGPSASDPVARKSDIDGILAAISGALVVAQDGGASLQTTIISGWPGSVGSSKVKSE